MTLHLTPEELIARHKAQQKAWRLAHPDKIAEYNRKYHARPEVKERRLQWGRDNKEKINARRRELYRERHPRPSEGLAGICNMGDATEPSAAVAVHPRKPARA